MPLDSFEAQVLVTITQPGMPYQGGMVAVADRQTFFHDYSGMDRKRGYFSASATSTCVFRVNPGPIQVDVLPGATIGATIPSSMWLGYENKAQVEDSKRTSSSSRSSGSAPEGASRRRFLLDLLPGETRDLRVNL
jgi:hypothetical protein